MEVAVRRVSGSPQFTVHSSRSDHISDSLQLPKSPSRLPIRASSAQNSYSSFYDRTQTPNSFGEHSVSSPSSATRTQDLAKFFKNSSPEDFKARHKSEFDKQFSSIGSVYKKGVKLLRTSRSKPKMAARDTTPTERLPDSVVPKLTSGGKSYLQIKVDYERPCFESGIYDVSNGVGTSSSYCMASEHPANRHFRDSMTTSTTGSRRESSIEDLPLTPAPWNQSHATRLARDSPHMSDANRQRVSDQFTGSAEHDADAFGACGTRPSVEAVGGSSPNASSDSGSILPSTTFRRPATAGSDSSPRMSTSMTIHPGPRRRSASLQQGRRSVVSVRSMSSIIQREPSDGERSSIGPPPTRCLPALPESSPRYSPAATEAGDNDQTPESSSPDTGNAERVPSARERAEIRRFEIDMFQAKLSQAKLSRATRSLYGDSSPKDDSPFPHRHSTPHLPSARQTTPPVELMPRISPQRLPTKPTITISPTPISRSRSLPGAPTPPKIDLDPIPSSPLTIRRLSTPLPVIIPTTITPPITRSLSEKTASATHLHPSRASTVYSTPIKEAELESRLLEVERRNRVLEQVLMAVIRGSVSSVSTPERSL